MFEKFTTQMLISVEQSKPGIKKQHYPPMEEALFIWILQQREANIIVPADILRAKGESLFREFQEHGCYYDQSFLASKGWAQRFKERHGLRMVITAGEKASADLDAYAKFKPVLMQKILDMGISGSQLFNADELAIFVKLIASKTVVLWDEKAASGRKLNKTRYTFMPCSNYTQTNLLIESKCRKHIDYERERKNHSMCN